MSTFDISSYGLTGDEAMRRRWRRSFVVAFGLHAGVAVFFIGWTVHPIEPEAPPPAIMIDMQPTPPAPTQKRMVEPDIKPKELPVVEKAAVVLKKVKPKPRPERPMPKKPEPAPVVNQQAAPAAPVKARSPIEARPALAPNYLSRLFAHLERYKKYPRVAGSRQVERVVLVHVEFERNGHITALAVVRSSGSGAYDRAALSTFRRADPLPSFPDAMTQQSQSLNIPVRFKLVD